MPIVVFATRKQSNTYFFDCLVLNFQVTFGLQFLGKFDYAEMT